MKFAVIALFLGGTAVVCSYAVRSDLIHHEPPVIAECKEVGAILERLGFAFPKFRFAPVSSRLAALAEVRLPSRLTLLPMLPKGETLLLIAAAAQKHKVPAAFVKSIVAAESNFNCAAISEKGAIGLMQLMPATAQEFGADPTIPSQNIDAGTRYLRWLMTRYQNSRSSMKRVIAAYNAGPGMVDRYRGVPPFRETRTYVARVLNFMKQFEGSRKRPGSRG